MLLLLVALLPVPAEQLYSATVMPPNTTVNKVFQISFNQWDIRTARNMQVGLVLPVPALEGSSSTNALLSTDAWINTYCSI